MKTRGACQRGQVKSLWIVANASGYVKSIKRPLVVNLDCKNTRTRLELDWHSNSTRNRCSSTSFGDKVDCKFCNNAGLPFDSDRTRSLFSSTSACERRSLTLRIATLATRMTGQSNLLKFQELVVTCHPFNLISVHNRHLTFAL